MNGNIFWNRNEKRLRAFWRLLLQGILFFVVTSIGSVFVSVLVVALIVASGGNLTDPQLFSSIMNHPLTLAGSALSSLLAIFISYWIAARWLDRRPFRDFGLFFNQRWWADLGFGLLLGAFLMLTIFLAELSLGWVSITGYMQSSTPLGAGFWTVLLISLMTFISVGFYEEMLFRGYHLRNLAEGLNLKFIGPRGALLIAYILSSSVFGLAHLGNPNANFVSTLNIIIAGIFLGLGFVLTGSLAIPIGLHITWNFFQGNVFGFPVSGLGTSASFIGIQQAGPEAWTGGAFGPEAGIIGLLAMLLGGLLTALWVRFRYGKAGLKDSLAVYTPQGQAQTSTTPDMPVTTIQDGG